MAGTRAAIRYAKAALSLASDQNTAEVVNNDMMLITNTVTEHLDLSEMLKNSVINSETKKTILLSIFPNFWATQGMLLKMLPNFGMLSETHNLGFYSYMALGAVVSLFFSVLSYRFFMKRSA